MRFIFQLSIHRDMLFKNIFLNLILEIFSSKIIIIIIYLSLPNLHHTLYIISYFLLYSYMRYVPRTNSDFSGLMIVDRTVKSIGRFVVPLQTACADFMLIHSERRVAREWIRADASLSRDSRRLVIITGFECVASLLQSKERVLCCGARNSWRIASRSQTEICFQVNKFSRFLANMHRT